MLGLSTEPAVAGIVVLGDAGLADLVFLLGQFVVLPGARRRFAAAGVAGLGRDGVVVGLLDLLVEGFLNAFKLDLLSLETQFGRTDAVADGESLEDGDVQRQADVLLKLFLSCCPNGAACTLELV